MATDFDISTLDDWDAPTCLRWLAQHADGPNYFAERAADWANEVQRFALYEHREPEEYNAEATRELQEAVKDRICATRPFPDLAYDAPPVPEGLEPRPGVEYGCGRAECTDCYRRTGTPVCEEAQ